MPNISTSLGKYTTLKFWCLNLCAIQVLMALSSAINTVAFAKTTSQDIEASKLLHRADRIRFPDEGFQVDVTINTTKDSSATPEVRVYRIISKGNDKTLVKTISPAIDRNQVLLMRDHDFWAFLPNLSQPIRLPLSQRLTGEVANGDLARSNFVGDYKPQLLRTETINGSSYHVLQLDAVDNWVTYHRVLYWVATEDARPYKAEFFAISGRLLKTAYYQKFHKLGDEIRPTRIRIEDALKPENFSTLDYSDMRILELPDKIFSKDYLKKLAP